MVAGAPTPGGAADGAPSCAGVGRTGVATVPHAVAGWDAGAAGTPRMRSLNGVRATTAPAAFQRSTRATRLWPKSSKVGT
jgi:hypothetical protein